MLITVDPGGEEGKIHGEGGWSVLKRRHELSITACMCGISLKFTQAAKRTVQYLRG